MNILVYVLLSMMAFIYNRSSRLGRYLRHEDGFFHFTVGFRSERGGVDRAISFREGRVRVLRRVPGEAEVVLRFRDDRTVLEMLRVTPNEMLMLILGNRMVLEGNIGYLQLFNFYISLIMGRVHRRMMLRKREHEARSRSREFGAATPGPERSRARKREAPLSAPARDPGVLFLGDPYLSGYGLDDFPRLRRMLERHFTEKPWICVERPLLLTRWHRENGFETDREGRPWAPELRQALAFRHLMSERRPLVGEDDLIAGTTTSKLPTGVVLYPDAHALLLWGELLSVPHRHLNPYEIDPEDARTLHHDIFPYWMERNFKARVHRDHGYPLSMRIEERWVYYFVWKSVGLSHTVPDYPAVLTRGTRGIMADIDDRLSSLGDDDGAARTSLEAMRITLEGVEAYAENLSIEAQRLAGAEPDPRRRSELLRLGEICRRVPREPARTLDEAVNCVWIVWVALHMENTNTGLSMGRLDRWLQPYFEADMKNVRDEAAREAYIRHALELVGCLLMRGTDHLPLVPDIGNYLFGGSSSDQAITLGGVTPEGGDGVCDMTYIFLKATEMLAIRDPNVNARFDPERNSPAYLRRLCEVNYATAATPSLHNDAAVMRALSGNGYGAEEIRDWSATGCVEPTLSGRHMGHTGSILMNLVSALEMALNNGRHPHMPDERLGPETGIVESGDFASFEDFFAAYEGQQAFLIDQAVAYNNLLAAAHAQIRPTPFLSALIEGCIETARDVTAGGARHNSSGTANIGLSDVVDSLMVIRKLIFEEKRISFPELKAAVDRDFRGDGKLLAMIRAVPKFGSGSPEAIDLARRLMAFIHGEYASKRNYRGGPYTAGFWSMSQHVAYGNLSGTLPSGRLAGKAFTPGLTPHPGASRSFLDNIRDVAALDPALMDNNIAFNVKLVPAAGEGRRETVEAMEAYVRAYFDLGGMQMQFNMVSSDTLRDAMAHPEQYRNLLVRISGYNAYFVTLNREMQIELIERAEYGV